MEFKVIFTDGSTRWFKGNGNWTFAGDNLERIDYHVSSPNTLVGYEVCSILLNNNVLQVVIDGEVVYDK